MDNEIVKGRSCLKRCRTSPIIELFEFLTILALLLEWNWWPVSFSCNAIELNASRWGCLLWVRKTAATSSSNANFIASVGMFVNVKCSHSASNASFVFASLGHCIMRVVESWSSDFDHVYFFSSTSMCSSNGTTWSRRTSSHVRTCNGTIFHPSHWPVPCLHVWGRPPNHMNLSKWRNLSSRVRTSNKPFVPFKMGNPVFTCRDVH